MFGGLFGFLLGLPRGGTETENSNLVEISDWLTKILVGAGLVTLTKIPPKLGVLAAYFGSGFNNEPDGPMFSLVLVIFNAGAGFLWLYMWARLNFPGELARSRADAQSVAASVKEGVKQGVKEGVKESQSGVKESFKNEFASLKKTVASSGVSNLFFRALSLPPTKASPGNEVANALRNEAMETARVELAEHPHSREIAIQYARLLEEQMDKRAEAIEILDTTLAKRRSDGIEPDRDDAALLFNAACYLNRTAREDPDGRVKEKLRSEAKARLAEALKIDPPLLDEIRDDEDVNDLGF